MTTQKPDSHVVIFGDGLGFGEKYCKVTVCSEEKDLTATLDKGPVDLVLVTKRWDKTVDSIRSNPYQGDIPILIVGRDRKKAEKLCDDGGCTSYVSPTDSFTGMFSKVGQYLSIGNLLSSARETLRKANHFQ